MSALLRLLSVLCSLVLLVSFAMFASDQADHGSKQTVARIAANDNSPAPAEPAPKPDATKEHSGFRKAVDGANDKLVGPFKGVIATDSVWAEHIAQSVLAFLVFGVGIGFLARYASTKGV
jgi:hypothetical protein